MQIIYFADFKEKNNFFKGCDFNLTSKFQIKSNTEWISEGRIKINLDIALSESINYFSENSHLTDIKVLIGSNGVGKTTLFKKIIGTFSLRVNPVYNATLLITNNFCYIGGALEISEITLKNLIKTFGNKFCFYHSISSNFHDFDSLKATHKIIGNNRSNLADNLNEASLIYYNNSFDLSNINSFSGKDFTTEEIAENGSAIIDISTSNTLVRSSPNKLFISALRNLNNISALGSLKYFDSFEILEFIRKNQTLYENSVDKYLINKIKFGLKINPVISNFIEIVEGIIPITELYNDYPNFHLHYSGFKSDYLTSLYKDFVLSIIIKLADQTSEEDFTKNLKSILADFEKVSKKYEFRRNEIISFDHYAKFAQDLISKMHLIDSINGKEAHTKFREITVKLASNEQASRFILDNPFDEVSNITFEPSQFLIDVHNLSLDLISLDNYAFPFLFLEINNVSSGELNYLNLISRINKCIEFGYTHLDPVRTNFILLLDEPELGLHPEWQKSLFNKLIRFFNNISTQRPSLKIQLILAVHSPLLLSDFGKSNIIRMRRDNDRTLLELSKTSPFGSNIYSILKDSFYFTNGYIGDYASEILKDLIKFLKAESDLKYKWDETKAQAIINEIGDELLRDRYQALFDQQFIGDRKKILLERKKRIEDELNEF